MQYLRQVLGFAFSLRMLAFVAVLLLALAVWFVGPLLAIDGLRPLATTGVRLSIILLFLVLGLLWAASWPFSLVAVAALCLLVWHGGPLLSVGAAQPLAPVWVRTAIIAGLVLFYAVYWLHRLWQALRNNEDLLAKFLNFGKQGQPVEVAKEELKSVAATMNRAVSQLKHLRLRGGDLRRIFEGKRYLYELPWFMIVGSSGAGKTTALLNSGLQFPVARQMGNLPKSTVLQSHRGTVHCDWWFTNQAVLIDTAGRYVTQEREAAKDPAEWLGFLALLRKHRARAPLNGAIVALDVHELVIMNAQELSAHAVLVRDRLAELRTELGIRFPVYVLVTKADLLTGFTEYFRSLTSEGRAQAWGFALPLANARGLAAGTDDRPGLREQLVTELGLLRNRVAAGVSTRLHEEADVTSRRKLIALPHELTALIAPLVQVLDEVFLDSRFDSTQANNPLRGVYFSSATQAEPPLSAEQDTVAKRLAHSLAAPTRRGEALEPLKETSASGTTAHPRAESAAAATSALSAPEHVATHEDKGARIWHSYFLQDLLAKVIVPESHLVRPNMRWEFRFRLLRLFGHALALLVFLWLLGGFALSYTHNNVYLDTIEARTLALARQVRTLFATLRPAGVPEILNSARELPDYPGLDPESPPGNYLYGLYSVPPIVGVSKQTYAALQDNTLLPTVIQRMETVLAQSVKDRDATTAYATLRVYKLLHDKERYLKDGGARDVRNWVLKDWETADSAAVFGGRASMVGHVQQLFSGDRLVQSASLPNEALVRDAQSFLDSNTSTQRVYERAKAAMQSEAPQEFTLVRAVGPQVGTVFSRSNGLPLEKGVPGLFTYDGYHDLFNKRLPEFVGHALEDDAWVMGRGQTGSTGDKANVLAQSVAALRGDDPMLQDIRRQYLSEYAQHWDEFLHSIRTVGGADITGGSLGFDLTVLRQFAAPDSPLARLARAAARETTLSRPLGTHTQEDKSFFDKAGDELNKRTGELSQTLGIRPEERLEKQLVDDRFAALREVVTGQPDVSIGTSAGAKPGLEAVSGLINEFYTMLVVADTALAAGSLPPNATEIGAKLKLEASKLPAPFQAVLTALASSGGDKVVQGATDILRKQAQEQLDRINGLMALQVSEPCKRGLEGRYPLAAVAQDASIEDFTLVFAAGGAADEFFNKYLAPFVDTSVRPWRYKNPSSQNAIAGIESLAAGAIPAPAVNGPTLLGELLKLLATSGPNLDSFYRAQQVRELFFRDAGGKKLAWKFDLKVLDLDPSITDLVVDIDGQGERYVHGPVQPFSVNWPGPRGGTMAALIANPRITQATSTVRAEGPWALFRLVDKGHVDGTATPGHTSVEYSFDGRKALIDIGAGLQANPFNSDLLKGFHCPGRTG